ncbi:MAG: 50S ribosomal protein L29 [Deltaproteobacteria bacterium]|nr:50S ribosomal protein L29 [Deltaproteobacteria bacterium]
MKPSEIRETGVEELRGKVGELAKELFNLRLQHSMGQLENPLKLRLIRRDIARIKTIISEKERKA